MKINWFYIPILVLLHLCVSFFGRSYMAVFIADLCFILIWIFVSRKSLFHRRPMKLSFPIHEIPVSMILCFSYTASISIASELVSLPDAWMSAVQMPVYELLTDEAGWFLAVFLFSGPIADELAFRLFQKQLQNTRTKDFAFLISALAQAGYFWLITGNFYTFPLVLSAAVLIALVYESTQSLWLTMLAQFSAAFGMFMMPLGLLLSSTAAGITAAALLIIVAVCLFSVFRRIRSQEEIK